MVHLPMWGPDPAKSGPSEPAPSEPAPSKLGATPASGELWISPEELYAPDAPLGPESDLAELAAKFSAHGGGGLSKELSADLALEIVLNEIVEQACLATGATGAAIVLARDGELVCRASTGATAPELGVRLDTNAGLTGACVKTRRIQRCDDAQSDARADMEASRWLGIRSVMILPLQRNNDLAGDLLGVFEVFSSRPSAFGERDQRTLEALAQRVLWNLRRASETLLPKAIDPPEVSEQVSGKVTEKVAGRISARVPEKSPARVSSGLSEKVSERVSEKVPEKVPEKSRLLAEPDPRTRDESPDVYATEVTRQIRERHFDGVTLTLGAVVFACAVLLSTLVGLHLGRHRATVDHSHKAKFADRTGSSQQSQHANSSNAGAPAAPAPAGSATAADASAAVGTSATSAEKAGSSSAQPESRESGSRQTGTRPALVSPPPGSLLIYENGKEVFRMLPSRPGEKQTANRREAKSGSPAEATSAFALSSIAAENSLIRRVEPEYPKEARQKGIQGPVVLDLHIGKDGAVQDVGFVSGETVLADAATSAVKQWRFKPRYVDGREVEMQTRITLRFTLPASQNTN